MFAPAYMGRKRILPMLLLRAQGPFLLAADLLPNVLKALKGAAPHRPRPMYAQANMGHPSREEASFFASTVRAGLARDSSIFSEAIRISISDFYPGFG